MQYKKNNKKGLRNKQAITKCSICKQNTQQTACLHLWRFREGRNTLLQVQSSDC